MKKSEGRTAASGIHRVTTRGRKYVYLQQGRGTKEQGPRIPLPDTSAPNFSSEFRKARARSTRERRKTDVVQLKLRLREDLRRKLEREAAKKNHSLNAEMVHRLEMSFTTDLVGLLSEGVAKAAEAAAVNAVEAALSHFSERTKRMTAYRAEGRGADDEIEEPQK